MVEIARKKQYYFKGTKFEDLKNLSDEQVLKLVNSRARRSLKRGLTFDQKKLMEKVDEANKEIAQGKIPKPIKTHSRNAIVVPKMIGLKVGIHTGKSFEIIEIKHEMIGHYLGEFVMTRKRVMHTSAGSGGKKKSVSVK